MTVETARLTKTVGPVTRTQIVRFAGAAGDFNPMHHDEPFAQAAGQDSVFAMGQLTAALLADAVAGWFGAERIAAYGVRFKGKVLPGDSLALSATPDGEGRWALEARRDGTDEIVLTGEVRTK